MVSRLQKLVYISFAFIETGWPNKNTWQEGYYVLSEQFFFNFYTHVVIEKLYFSVISRFNFGIVIIIFIFVRANLVSRDQFTALSLVEVLVTFNEKIFIKLFSQTQYFFGTPCIYIFGINFVSSSHICIVFL